MGIDSNGEHKIPNINKLSNTECDCSDDFVGTCIETKGAMYNCIALMT